jgi:tetratricopeptide (TPR) repeat protein
MDAGKTALQKGNYTLAIDKFENALEEKETTEAKEYLHVAESMQESLTLYHKGDFDAAIYTLNKMVSIKLEKNVNGEISKQAKALIKEIQEAKSLANSLNERMIKGKTLLEQNQYDQAMEVFKEVSQTIEFPEISTIDKMTQDASKLILETTKKKKTAEQEQKQQDVEKVKKNEEEKRKQEKANKTLTHEQAEELVRQHLEIQSEQNVKVVYDHDTDNGDYIIHVYEFVVDNPKTGEGHTTTWGWYGVNKQTRVVYDAMN